MCGRYALNCTSAEFVTLFGQDACADFGLRYNWESWKVPDGSILRTVCVVTTSPNSVMEPIHDRMPVIVAPEHWQSWLSGMPEEVAGLVGHYCDDELQAWSVSRRVSKTQDDDVGLIEPMEVRA